jgi:uncharacterized protein YqjF (DUF2071 family)
MIKPTLEMRLTMREKPPNRTPVMYEKWHDLLFLHWEYDSQTIQRMLPKGLHVDTFDDKAYLGVAPFFMRAVRPRLFPSIPGVSDFLELNVRTYVYDSNGTPGVWFYSLDANHYLAVKAARLFFNLPYFYANITAELNPDNKEISYSSYRYGTDPNLKTHFRYRSISDTSLAQPGTLEFFLIERYILFAYSNNTLYSGRVWHSPYQLTEVEVSDLEENVLCLDGFSSPSRPPDHRIMSSGVKVEIFGLEKLN